jgi:hypothetical protein
LRTAGAIPLSSSAVAARTAQTKRAEFSNGFTQTTSAFLNWSNSGRE